MKTKDFLKKHSACKDGAKWALSISKDMGDVWEAMIAEEKHTWLIWTLSRAGVFPDSVLRKLACRFIRETPLLDGMTVWALLEDNRSRKAVEVAERFADGKATNEELKATSDATFAAVYDACAADATAYSAAYAARAARAARAAAYNASHAAYVAAYAARAAYHAAYVYAATRDADTAARVAYAHAKAAQIKMIAELGNPFKERAKQ